MNKLTLNDLDVSNKKVLMRVDFNVPIKDGYVTDDTRIVAALPSIQHVLDNGGSLILISHCGRPKGEKNMEYTLKPAVERLSQLVDASVSLAPDVIGDEVKKLVDNLNTGEILVLENVRFYKEEEGKGCTSEEQDTFSRQFVVHEALETISWPAYASVLTPHTNIGVLSFDGADKITFFAPASICLRAVSSVKKKPVDSTTTSASTSPQAKSDGSRSAVILIFEPFTTNDPLSTLTSP